MNSRARALLSRAGLVLSGVAVTCVAVWAAGAVTRPAEDPLDKLDYTLVEVVPGEVGSSIQLNTVAEWTPVPEAANRAVGVVTSVVASAGSEVSQGSVLYSVDLRPVVVAQGEVPAFRDVGEGDAGPDVRQVQQLLSDLGFYHGEIGGEAGGVTAAAIRAWQKSLGVPQTGTVSAGDMIFVPSLPTRIALDPDIIHRGATVVGGEQILASLPPAPDFTLPVTEAQSTLIPVGTRVEISSPDGGTWQASAGKQSRDPDAAGTVVVDLAGIDGAAICGDQCAQVPVAGQASLSSRVVTVETASGLVVPSSALVSSADGELAVVDSAGVRLPVTVIAAARGMSVIKGVDAGTRVRVPGSAQ